MTSISTKRLALLSILLIVSVTVRAEPRVEVRADVTATGCGKDQSHKEDNMVLFVKTDDAQTVTLPFCSAYGRATAFLERDAKQQYYALLRYDAGRGVNAESGYLKIFKIGPKLQELKTLQLSASSGSESRWVYEIDISKPEAGGLRIALNLKQEGAETKGAPKEKRKVVDVR